MPKRILGSLATPGRLAATLAAATLLAVVGYASTFVISYGDLLRTDDPLLRTDVARLVPARVARVDEPPNVEQLQAIVQDAKARGLKVSIAGSRHSQGGHTYTAGGVVLNMRAFNRVLAVDTIALTITVESGATWDEVQRAIAPHGLAIKVMQSSNIFTVGGTLSANAHGRDIDVTQVVEVVQRLRLLLADGGVVEVSRRGELIIFHDLSVDRLTSGTGRVSEKTLPEMLALDLGPKYDSAIRGANVRTFEDFVRAVKGRGILMVELKVPGLGETGIERRAVEIIQKHDAHASVVLSSFNPFVLRRLKQLDPKVRTALIFMDTNWNAELRAEIREGDLVDLPWAVRQEFLRRAFRKIVKPDLLSINHEVDEDVIDRLIAKGWPVFIWTTNDDDRIRFALSKRPYGVISDQPLRARELRGQ